LFSEGYQPGKNKIFKLISSCIHLSPIGVQTTSGMACQADPKIRTSLKDAGIMEYWNTGMISNQLLN
jgi:hypothetical protein